MSARFETRTNAETGKVEYLERGVNLSVGEPSELFNDDPMIKVSTLKELVADVASFEDFVAAIEAL